MSSFVWKSCYKFQTDFVSNFQTSLRHNIFPLLFQEILLLPACKFCKTESSDHFAWSKVQKWTLWSFWGLSHDLLGHLDGRPPLSEAFEPLESVVYENPVLVRLTGVVIWRSGWKRGVKVIFKTGECWEILKGECPRQVNTFIFKQGWKDKKLLPYKSRKWWFRQCDDKLTDFEINFWEVVKVGGVVNWLHLQAKSNVIPSSSVTAFFVYLYIINSNCFSDF